jgi:hypothetical protein
MEAQYRFQAVESNLRKQVKVRMVYVDITGDLISGILLSQIVYWHLPNKESGKPKLKIFKEGHLWLAKERSDWWNECRITPKQYDRAIKILIEKGIVEVKKFKFDGIPTIHLRLLYETLENLLNQENIRTAEFFKEGQTGIDQRGIPELTKGESRTSPKVNTGIDLSGILLTDITNIHYNKQYLQNDDDEQAPFEIDISAFRKLREEINENCPNQFDDALYDRIYRSMIRERISFITYEEAIEQARYMDKRKDKGEIIGDYAAYFVGGVIKKRKSEASALNQRNIAKAKQNKKEPEQEPPVPFYNWLVE